MCSVGKGRRERKVRPQFAWCTFPCVRVTVMQLRERAADRKHENKTRPTVGGFTPLYLSRGEGRARIAATLLAPARDPLERIWNAGIALFSTCVTLPLRFCTFLIHRSRQKEDRRRIYRESAIIISLSRSLIGTCFGKQRKNDWRTVGGRRMENNGIVWV